MLGSRESMLATKKRIQFGGDFQEEKGKVIDYLSLRHGY
jgi:hypothetical protein